MSTDEADRPKTVAVLVAHPDDETLWTGGTILSHPSWNWYIATLCRASDPDRAPRFHQALRELGAAGSMADVDDGPDQIPLDPAQIQRAILEMLPSQHFDLLITHDPAGEYTRHLRHEEVSRAVIGLWDTGQVAANELWTFAYEDGSKRYLPRPIEKATVHMPLSDEIWRRKYDIITTVYGFPMDGFEAQTTPRAESFWRFASPLEAQRWMEKVGSQP